MKGIGNARKAVSGRDDVTLTRWIKTEGRGHSGKKPSPMPLTSTGTRYKSRVMDTDDRPLVSGHSNLKIGRDVRKGHLKGYWIYTLTLEERATCPRSCHHWATCYGNGSPFARRLRPGPALEAAIESQLDKFLTVRRRKGVLVRLHALGDFYSVEYVGFWRRMLEKHPRLSIYGYTARSPFEPIGAAVFYLHHAHPQRFAVRWSDGDRDWGATVSIQKASECPTDAFVCPEQTGKTRCCATCAACWGTSKNVAFIAH